MEPLLAHSRRLVVVCFLTPTLCLSQALVREQNLPKEQSDASVTFSVPGSSATYPLSINETETVTGYYVDSSSVSHGFVRDPAGQITTFDAPGAILTRPTTIDTAGDIAGYYEVSAGIPLGFIRDANGNFTTFGNPASTFSSSSFWAQPVALNVAGEIAGNYPDATLASRAFLRSSTGVVQSFSLTLGGSYPTVATGLNNGGAVVGYYSSQGLNVAQGFYWDGQGPLPTFAGGFTTISVPGSSATFPTALNADGTIAGCYSVGGVYHDFVRSADGLFTTLDLPGAPPACLEGDSNGVFNVTPLSVSLNDEGTVAGYFTTPAKITVGFVRFANGTTRELSLPGSQLTLPTGLNNHGAITGYYSNGSTTEGFLQIPTESIQQY